MADTNDTIDGLLAEFRGYAAGMPDSYHVTMSWADFRKMLDRFDAANKREREAITPKSNPCWKDICAKCMEGDIEPHNCEYYGEPNGCNSPIYGEHPTAENSSAIGNAAKLREALSEILSYIESFHKYIIPGKREKTTALFAVADTIRNNARAALAAPPRNCDKVKTSWDVLKEWHEGLDTANDIVRLLDWLLAPATEKEGGNNGNE